MFYILELIKKMRKFLFVIVLSLSVFFSYSFAQEYFYFHGNGCSHCVKVEKFFNENDLVSKYNIKELEIYFNRNNLKTFSDYIEKLWIDPNKAWVPFLVIDSENECDYVAGDKKIIWFFQEKLIQDSTKVCEEWEDCPHFDCNDENCPHLNCGEIDEKDISWGISSEKWDFTSKWSRRRFFGIMLPAAFADSINPCAFAVMLILLSSILTKTKSKRKAIISGFVFALSVFLSYFAMGLGLFSALATATNTFVIKIIVWILWILVWLANLKDFFWYGKWFIMEVPLAWRPKMQKVIKWAVSPLWAFVVGFLVSLFLLPCTSGPYFTILGYLASESKNLHTRWYIYLIVYNIIFILPMVLIVLLVWLWFKSAEELAELKSKNAKLIHLIVWLLMLGLWIYVLLTM